MRSLSAALVIALLASLPAAAKPPKVEPFDGSLRTLMAPVDDPYRRWTWIRKDGRPITVQLSMTPMTDPDGQHTGFVGIATDCFMGDAAKIEPKPACKLEEVRVVTRDVRGCGE